MFEIVFLGTSASAPSIYRGLPAQAVLAGEHRYLIDCGEGTQRQILRSGIGFKRLNNIFLTHAQLDHILGLGGLISTFASWEDSIDQIDIWGGRNTLDRVQKLLFGVVLDYERLPIRINLIDLQPGKMLETKDHTVSAFSVSHRGPGNFGFVFQEKSRRPFLNDQADALGVPVGPERGLLVSGQTVILADGRAIRPDDVLGEEVRGAKLVHIGDVGRLDTLRDVVADADALVIEATFLDIDAEAARSFGHITAKQAATLAAECSVKSLILTHVSRRYRESDLIAEARSVFPTAYVARDLDHFVVRRGQPAEKLAREREKDRTEGDEA